MNIFMVTKPISPLWDEGSKNLAFNLCKQIKNHKFHLITCKNTRLPLMDNVTYHYFYPDHILNKKIDLFNKVRLFYKLLSQKDVDIYHFIFTPRIGSSYASSIFLKFLKKKSVQNLSTPLTDSELKKCLFGDKIIALSEWTKKRVLELGHNNVVKINPGIDLEKFSKKKIPMIRNKLGLSKDDFAILFPVEYSIERGSRIALEAFKQLVHDFPQAKLIFACRIRHKRDIEEKKSLIKIVSETDLNGKVIFLDRIDYMPELINSSDIVILPMLSPFIKMETPMVLLEALALEKPIIISDIPPLNEIFLNSEVGIKIKPGDSEALLNSIIRFIKHKKLKNEMGKAGRKLVEKEFDIRNIAREYEKLYEGLK